jgi:hypothetical protein
MKEQFMQQMVVDRAAVKSGGANDGSSSIAPVLTQSRSFGAPAEAEWHRMISEAAYYLAARRNFVPGSELEDWLAAEAAAKDFLSPR